MKAVSVGLHARARHGRRRCDGAGGRARFPPTVQRGGPHCPRWQRSAGWSWSWGASLQAATMAAVTPARPELRPHDRPCFSRGAPCPMPASHPPRRLLPASAPLGGPCGPRTSHQSCHGTTSGLPPRRKKKVRGTCWGTCPDLSRNVAVWHFSRELVVQNHEGWTRRPPARPMHGVGGARGGRARELKSLD